MLDAPSNSQAEAVFCPQLMKPEMIKNQLESGHETLCSPVENSSPKEIIEKLSACQADLAASREKNELLQIRLDSLILNLESVRRDRDVNIAELVKARSANDSLLQKMRDSSLDNQLFLQAN